jgi:O-antigen ligase
MIRRHILITRYLHMPLLLGAMILFTLVLGRLVADQRQMILGALFVALPMTILAFRSFERLVLGIAPAALLVSSSLPTGTESRISIVMLLVMLLTGIWILATIVNRTVTLQRSPLNAPLFVFALVCCLALIWSMVFRDPLLIRYDNFIIVQLGALAAMILSPAAALLIANFIKRETQLWSIVWLFLVVGAITTLGHLGGVTLPGLNTRGLFPLWFVACSYGIVVAHPSIPLAWRYTLALLLLLHLYDIVIDDIAWLSGWVPALVAILMITLLRSKIAFLALLLLLAIVVTWRYDWLYENIVGEAERDGSYERLTLWELNIELVENHPLFGAGPAGYALYYVTYHPDEARSTHNNYMDIIAQTGIVGALCWLWLALTAIHEGWVVLKHAPPGSTRTLAYITCGGLLGSMVAMQLGDWIIPFAYNQGIEGYRYTVFSWLFLGILMSLRQQLAPLRPRQPQGDRHGYNANRRIDRAGELEHQAAPAGLS